ncbi:HlyD family type I secretion periplasmic adaptor subunit [Neoehrlichia mikurensis]|uniref:Membrane fusion protein (MFP) family protein n=1 Tax=Neoehrlichia mikurensis TaxID=89586 RepID=A0A9Q9F4F9_9RICK|nr:HlyD family type I secretion periplasmic adaptor subunit [Neoehrlichia mikurensis]QXK92179.1 HlyD family type I secretion periplasmic adaptor subunit [Neoehrlichia mikurensis]QXK92634.1 HlyD family type I secretion periplasmic adaptor subunit [Neoehrlichia mikurensis]QXK93872.1 HlyD family type I secretion periplasmic adaptor subunit [Neoehrlichia mikurensis]UTO55131.1 HlyD family type I secretion periplasmic adaptor subunit [Neoehrlichia mikurensis]UTO56051.1 HlyD family type I secretion p
MYKRLQSIIKSSFSLPQLLGHDSLHKHELKNKHNSQVTLKLTSFSDSIVNLIFRIKGNHKINDAVKVSWGPLFIGLIIIIIFFGFFGIWAATAPLDGAVIATGEVMSSLNRQIVQHFEGGIIKKISVQEGEIVQKNQPLIYLNDTAAKANLSILQERMLVLLSTEARLIAIKNNLNNITFPSKVYTLSDKKTVDKVLNNQQQLFLSHRKSIFGKIKILKQRIKQLKQELSGLSAQLTAETKQYTLIKEELDTKKKLLKSGYISKPYILNLERLYAEAQGKLGHIKAVIASTQQKVGENQLEIINIINNMQDKNNIELKETDSAIVDLKERLRAAKDVLTRTIVRSPQNGVVTGLKYHTEGGVISPGSNIMDIVPINEDLVIEAKIPTRNIEEILAAQSNPRNIISNNKYTGLKAKVRLSAYNIRKFGLANGIMTQVSADAFSEYNGTRYYLTRVVIPKSLQLGKFKKIKLYPGMPAEVFIITQSRTLLNYLLTPITSTFEKAFKER